MQAYQPAAGAVTGRRTGSSRVRQPGLWLLQLRRCHARATSPQELLQPAAPARAWVLALMTASWDMLRKEQEQPQPQYALDPRTCSFSPLLHLSWQQVLQPQPPQAAGRCLQRKRRTMTWDTYPWTCSRPQAAVQVRLVRMLGMASSQAICLVVGIAACCTPKSGCVTYVPAQRMALI